MRPQKRVFLICPVRFATDEEAKLLEDYVSKLESQRYEVHYPKRDTNQEDSTGGYQICRDNCKAIKKAHEIHIYWNETSQGSLFDLGVAFNEHKTKKKSIKLVNRKTVEEMVKKENKPKSFQHVLLKLDDLAK